VHLSVRSSRHAVAMHVCRAAAILLIASRVFAQDTLTLDQCLARAASQSPQLHMWDNAARASELGLSELRTAALPQVRGQLSAIYAPVPGSFGYDPALSNGGQVAGQIVVQQSLYDAGMRGLKSEQLHADNARLAEQRRLTGRDLALAVTLSFIEALRAQVEVELQRAGVEQLDAYRDLTQNLYRSGAAGSTDVTKTELQTAAARIARDKAGEAAMTARSSLETLTGSPPGSIGGVAGSLDIPALGASDSLGTPTAVDVARLPDLRVAGMLIDRSRIDEDLARREAWPAINIFADAGYLGSGMNLRLPPGEQLNALGVSVGVGVDMPILTWGATDLRVQQRALATDDLRLQTELLRRSIESELRRTRLQVENAMHRLAMLRGSVDRADEDFLLTKARYAAGVALSLEVLDAQRTLTQIRIDELQTRADILSLRARFARLIGT
jgi:outer membrane protein